MGRQRRFRNVQPQFEWPEDLSNASWSTWSQDTQPAWGTSWTEDRSWTALPNKTGHDTKRLCVKNMPQKVSATSLALP